MTLFAGATQVQKAYIGASAVNAIMHAGVNVLGVNGSFPGITDSELYLPLTNTLVPTRGASTPTFTRATVAWDFDSEGKLNLNIPSGCPRFTGARLVRNRVATTSATLAVAASNTVTLARSETVTFSMGAGAGTATFSGTSGATGTLTASAGGRTEVTKTCTAGTFIITASVANLVDIQVEVVSGQSDKTASEYVSVGVLSAPFHGAGVDGCKWFSTNKDGSAISPSVLKKYLSEPSRVNNCLWSRDQRAEKWYTNGTGAELVVNGDFAASTGWTAEAGWAIGAGVLTGTATAIQVTTATGLDNVANSASRLTAAANDATLLQLLTAATGTRTTSVWIKRVSGSGTVSLTRNGGTGWTDITSSLVTGTWVPVALTSDVGANPTVGLKMGTSGDVIDVDCFQDENGAWRTSPILTTTAAVTRNADVLSYASAFDVAQGTALCSVQSNVPINSGAACYALGGDSSNTRFLYSSSADSRSSSSAYDGTTVASAVGNDITTGIRKRATRWGNDLKLCCDGNLGVTQIFDGSMGATPTLYIGLRAGGSPDQLSGNIGEVHIWTTPLTDAQMQQVTS
jgi:hypothetical protein